MERLSPVFEDLDDRFYALVPARCFGPASLVS
jgi:hypothetical protein